MSNLRVILVFSLGVILPSILTAEWAFAADPSGDWELPSDKNKIVRIAECRGSIWGVMAQKAVRTEGKILDSSKSHNPSSPTLILLDMKGNAAADKWVGKYSHEGKTYVAKMRLRGNDRLEVQACLDDIICADESWVRVAPPIPNSPVNKLTKGGSKSKSKESNGRGRAGNIEAVVPPSLDVLGDICIMPTIAKPGGG
jgi:uncharacterized protein (DUF2147 family)